MSISAILKGVETRLRSAAVLNDIPSEDVGKVCGVQPDGSPPAGAGQWYYAIYFSGMRNDDPNSLSLDWMYSVGIAITARMGHAPRDRRGARMLLENELLDRAIFVATKLHQNDTTRIEANKLIEGSEEYCGIHGGVASENGFTTPLKLRSIGKVIKAPPDWLYTETQTEAYYVEIALVDAQRIQLIPE